MVERPFRKGQVGISEFPSGSQDLHTDKIYVCKSNPDRYCNAKAKSLLDDATKLLKRAEKTNDNDLILAVRLELLSAQDIYDETSAGRQSLSYKIKKETNPDVLLSLVERKELAFSRFQEKENEAVRISGKVCRLCKEHKSFEHFSQHKSTTDKLQQICNECQAIRNKTYYKQTPEKNDARKAYRTSKLSLIRTVTQPLFEQGCTDCGKFYANAMDFDHIADGKTINISALSWQTIPDEVMMALLKKELEICEVRCCNCHRIVTYERQKKNNRLLFLQDPGKVSLRYQHVFKILEKSRCIDCGIDDLRVLEFDHVRGSKISAVSTMITRHSFSLADIDAEIGKCVVRCVNCHRRKTLDPEHPDFLTDQERRYVPTARDLTCVCGKPKQFGRNGCVSCANKPKIDWPPMIELIELVQSNSFLRVGKMLGVSDNAVRKHLKSNGIDPKTLKKYPNRVDNIENV